MREIVFKFEVEGKQQDTLKLTLELLFGDKGPSAWKEEKGTLYLYEWSAPVDAQKFPTKMPTTSLIPMVQSWLAEHKPVEKQYDGDGSTYQGFNIRVIEHRDIVQIKPVWIYYGK